MDQEEHGHGQPDMDTDIDMDIQRFQCQTLDIRKKLYADI
jgi:hypothetical protein